MRPQKVLDIEIIKGLTGVFRSKGYDGASMKELAEATGLKKASLYHRFPNGKQEMAKAVVEHLDIWVEEYVFKALLDKTYSPKERLRNGLTQIRILYNGGEATCIFRALLMETGQQLFGQQIAQGMQAWIATFQKLGIALGYSPSLAGEKALQVLLEIQGSLIVADGLNDLTIFEKTLIKIENDFLKE